jgi:hypothetical protein
MVPDAFRSYRPVVKDAIMLAYNSIKAEQQQGNIPPSPYCDEDGIREILWSLFLSVRDLNENFQVMQEKLLEACSSEEN